MGFNNMLSELHSFKMFRRKYWMPSWYIYYDETRGEIFNQDGKHYKFTIHDFIDEEWEEFKGV